MKKETQISIARISLMAFVAVLALSCLLPTFTGEFAVWFAASGLVIMPALFLGGNKQRWAAGFGILLVLGMIMYDHISYKRKIKNWLEARDVAILRVFAKLETELAQTKKLEEINQGDIFKPGYMYWSAPSLLAADWAAVVTGTVTDVKKLQRTPYMTQYQGKIKVNEILFSRPVKRDNLVKAEYIYCDGGFKGLRPGDKVIVFLVEYEDGYAIADFTGGNCQLGLKIASFTAPAVDAVKDRLKSGHISKKYYELWRDIDAKEFDTYLKSLNMVKETMKYKKTNKKS